MADIVKYDYNALSNTTKSIFGKHYNDTLVLPYTPDALRVIRDALLARQGLLIYQDMGRDDMVDLGLSLLIASLVPEVRVVPAGDSAECKLIADKVARQLDKMQGGAVRKFHKVLQAFLYGFSISEMCFGINTFGEDAGDIAIQDIKYRQPFFFDFKASPETGELEEIKQIDTIGNERVSIDIRKVIYFIVNDHVDPFRGQSIYRPVYWAWWQKQGFIKLRGIQAERRAGKLKMKHADPQYVAPSDFSTVSQTILENYQKSDGFVLPPGVDAEIVNGEADPADFTRLIAECDRVLLRPTKIPWLMVQEGIQTGSYSLAEVQERVMMSGHKASRQDLEEKLAERYGLVWWLCTLNGWDLAHAPRITFESSVESTRKANIEVYNTSVQAGTLTPVASDQNWLRAGLGLDEVDETETKKIETEPPPDEYEDDEPLTFAESRYSHIDFKPPKGVREAASRGLELRREFGRGGTAIGIARARTLSNGQAVSPDTARRMVSFFARHESDKREGWGNPEDPSNGYIAWLLWGGEPGKAWANKLKALMDSADGAEAMEQSRRFSEARETALIEPIAALKDSIEAIARETESKPSRADLEALIAGDKTRLQFVDEMRMFRARLEGALMAQDEKPKEQQPVKVDFGDALDRLAETMRPKAVRREIVAYHENGRPKAIEERPVD